MKIKNMLRITLLLLFSITTSNTVSAEPNVQQYITGLYTAYYNRAPDQEGFDFWNNQTTSGDNSAILLSISTGFMNDPKFSEDYPSYYSNTQFMTKVYTNVLSRAPDSEGFDFWVALLNNGVSKPKVIVEFTKAILSPQITETGLSSQRMFSNKINVGEYYKDRLGSASNGASGSLAYTRSQDSLQCVTENIATVDSAKALIRNYLTTNEPIENNCAADGVSIITGVVKESVSNNTLADVQIKLYHNGDFLEEVTTDTTGSYRFENLAARSGYSILLIKANYLTEDYNTIETQPNEIKYLETVLQINSQYEGLGNITGNIRNALDGSGVSGLNINIRDGINTRTGSIVRTATTGNNGNYDVFELEAGNYTGEISGSGYQINYFTILVLGGRTNEGQNGVVNPLLAGGEMRIVLSWGANPSDLDSHLTGPTSDNSSDRFHVYFGQASSTNINLDRDDVSSYGPETTTIQQQVEGLYRYSIHDYSNGGSSSSSAMANSSANVKVYNGNGLVAEFNVPNQAGTLWTVFEMRGNQITPINRMNYESSDTAFRYSENIPIDHTDALLLKNLPEKILE